MEVRCLDCGHQLTEDELSDVECDEEVKPFRDANGEIIHSIRTLHYSFFCPECGSPQALSRQE